MHRTSRLEPEILALASGQHGVLSVRQLNQFGLTERAIAGLVDRGVLERVRRGVLRLSASQPGFKQSLVVAVLAVGPPVVVSHGSAARIWGFDELGHRGIDLAVPPGRRSRGQIPARIHHVALEDRDTTTRDLIPVTNPVRTIADLALGSWHTTLLKRFVDHLLRARYVSRRDLLVGVERLGGDPDHADRHPDHPGRAGHPGHAAMRRLLDSHLEGAHLDGAVPGSGGESWVQRVAAVAGLPPLVAQYCVLLGDRLVWIDLAIPPLLIAVEFDGYSIHAGRGGFDADRRRWDDLTAAGWRVVAITSAMPEAEVVGRISRAVAERSVLGPGATDRPHSIT